MLNIRTHQLKLMALLTAALLPLFSFGQDHFSYTPDGKVNYELSTERALLRFQESYSTQQRAEAFEKFSLLPEYRAELELDTPRVILAKLAEGATPGAVEEMLGQLRQMPGVELANPFLVHQDGTPMSYTSELVVGLKEPGHYSRLEAAAAEYGLRIKRADEYTPTIFFLETTPASTADALAVANLLAGSGAFAFAEPHFIRLNLNFTNDPLLYAQWAIENTGNWPGSTAGSDMRVSQAWGITTGSANIRVAVIDDGVDLFHQDLSPNLLSGYDATGQGSAGNALTVDGHGTACAGIIGAVGNNNEGIAGVAYDCRIIPVRAGRTEPGGTDAVYMDAWIANGINWAWQNGEADVLSNSYGGGSSASIINNAIDNAVNNGRGGMGCPVLFAAGNDNTGTVYYPASYPPCIAVGAMSFCDERKSNISCDGETTWGSNYGSALDVMAPGVKVTTTDLRGTYGFNNGSANFPFDSDYFGYFNGTSAACPNAAGVMALVLSANPSLTGDEARTILESTCNKVGDYFYTSDSDHPNGTWNNEMGYGCVNAHAAVQAAQGNTGGGLVMDTDITVDPNPVIQGQPATISFNIENTGSEPFNGAISVDLYDANTLDYLDELDIKNGLSLCAGCTFPSTLEYEAVINEPAGDYIIVVWALPAGGDWVEVGDGNFDNIIEVEVVTGGSLSVSPTTIDFGPAASEAQVNVTSNSSWNASVPPFWVLINGGSGNGNGSFTISCLQNTGPGNRNATVTVIGGGATRTVSVTQEALSLSASPSDISFGASANSEEVAVMANTNWVATASAPWLTVAGGSGSADGTFTINCQPNTGGARNATVTVTALSVTRTIDITQEGASASLSVSPPEMDFGPAAGSRQATVTANVGWTASTSAPWLSIIGGSGNGNSSFTVNCQENTGTAPRCAEVTVSGGGLAAAITVCQEGQPPEAPWAASPTGEDHTIILPDEFTGTVDGAPLEPGDLIGFFYEHNGELHCSNFVQWAGEGTSLAAFGNDANAPEKNGFSIGELFHIKVYRAVTDEEFDATGAYAPVGEGGIVSHTNAYANDGISMLLSLEASSATTLSIPLAQGWNMISSYVDPGQPEMLGLLSEIAEEVILIKNGRGQSAIPSQGINNIGDWQLVDGYKLKASHAVSLEVTGLQADPAATPIHLAEGWQMIAYLRNAPDAVEEQLADIEEQVDIIKDNDGRNYIPAYDINTLGNLAPAQGYKIKASGPATLYYTANGPENIPQQPVLAFTEHFVLGDGFNTGNNATLVFPTEAFAGWLSPQDEVGVFTQEGALCGAAVVREGNFAVTVWGDDPDTPEKEGMAPDEAYQLRAWQASEGQEYSLAATYDPGDGLYSEDDLEVVSELELVSSTGSIGVEQQHLSVFPNPADGHLWIQLPEGIEYLSIHGAHGRLLRKLEPSSAGKWKLETAGLPAGLIILRAWDGQRYWQARVFVL